jgi:nucleotide-binding universal stress UspA family protein
MAKAPLLREVLVPLDGSELSERIVEHVRRLLVLEDATVTLLRVAGARGEPEDAARLELERVARRLRDEGATVRVEVKVGEPAAVLLDFARDHRPSLVAMATHGRSGIARWIRGSTAERVLRGSPAPLLLANPFALEPPAELRFQKILVPLDGSPGAFEVLPLAGELARLYGAEIILHMTVEVPPIDVPMSLAPMTTKDALLLLESWRTRVPPGVPVRTSAAYGPPAPAILEAAERERADLVALTTHGLTGARRWLLGSVAEGVLRHARCPLLVVRTSSG